MKKNYHLATRCRLDKVEKDIENYPGRYGYAAPKYLYFIRDLIKAGYGVKIYKPKRGASKYLFIEWKKGVLKVRYSNHRPIIEREEEGDCDYYVGVSNRQVSTSENVYREITTMFPEKYDSVQR